MKYDVNDMIKALHRAKKAGCITLSQSDLISIIQPKINTIGGHIKSIELGLKRELPSGRYLVKNITDDERFSFYKDKNVTFSEASDLTGIPRRTFYRWMKKGIIPDNRIKTRHILNLHELLNTLKSIKRHIKHAKNILHLH